MRTFIALVSVLAAGFATAAAFPAAVALKASAVVLSVSDFPAGATVVSETQAPSPYMPQMTHSSAFTRTISGARIGKTRLLELVSSASVASNPAQAGLVMNAFVTAATSSAGHAQLVAEVKRGLGPSTGGTFSAVTLLRDRPLHVGNSAIDIDFALTTTAKVKIVVEELYVQEGPVITFSLFASGVPGLSAGQSTDLAKTLGAHIAAGAGPPPSNLSVPTIAGTPEPGGILRAGPGAWTGSGLAYAYGWLSCSAAGAACKPIANATEATFTVPTTEVGATIEVKVTATNSAGSGSATSAATAAVAG